MKRNIPTLQYSDAWQILARGERRLNGTVVDGPSEEVMLRIEKSMSRLKVMGDDERRFFWIRARKTKKEYEWLRVMTAHYKDFHYLILSDGKYTYSTLQNAESVYSNRAEYREDLKEPLLALEAHVCAVVDWICENPGEYNSYVNHYLPYHKRDGDISREELVAINPDWDHVGDVGDRIEKMESVINSVQTQYVKKTLRNYISAWSAAYRILCRVRYEEDPDDEYDQERYADCQQMDDIELFKRYDTKGRYIEGLDLDAEEDFKKWYGANSLFHCMDVSYARIHLAFRGQNDDYESTGSPYHLVLWFHATGYWKEVMESAIGLHEQGITVEVAEADDILEFLRKEDMVGFRPWPDKYMNRDGVKTQMWLPYIGDVSREEYWKLIRAVHWHKEPEVWPMENNKTGKKCIQ